MSPNAPSGSRKAGIAQRHVWLALGWTALAAGTAGIVLPIVPTTPFALLAAAAFGKGSPRLKRWLEDSATFGPTLAAWRSKGAIATRHKVGAVATMATVLGASIALGAVWWALAIQAVCMCGASLFILTRPGVSAPLGRSRSPQPEHRKKRRPARWYRLWAHVLLLAGLLATAVALATWRGGLWPLDLGFSILVTLAGLGVLVLAWGPVWLGLLIASASLNSVRERLTLWPIATAALIGLHAVFGTDLGFMSLAHLGPAGALHLYAVPTALVLVLGSAVREGLRKRPSKITGTQEPGDTQ